MHNGLRMNRNMTLSNGTRILTDGTIVKSNGARATLTVGECMTKQGIIRQDEYRSEKKMKNKTIRKRIPALLGFYFLILDL